jgi:post-segregation antitoxin (ccd killing protein)
VLFVQGVVFEYNMPVPVVVIVSHRGENMTTITIGKDGVEFVHTNVIVPRRLRDLAKEQGISMSHELRAALEKKMKNGDAGADSATNTKAPASLSSTDKQVDV